MKNQLSQLLGLIVLAVISVSCQKSEVADDSNLFKLRSQPISFNIEASLDEFEETESKAYGGSFMDAKWIEGDEVSVVNLTTGKVMAEKLTSTATGLNVSFTGTISSGITAGDKIALLYPAMSNTSIVDFTSDVVSFASQTNGSQIQLCAYGVFTAESTSSMTVKVDFNKLMNFYKFNLTNLPCNTAVESVDINNVANSITLTINSDKSGFTVTPDASTKKIWISGFTKTNADGHLTVKAATLQSETVSERVMTVHTASQDYTSEINPSSMSSGKYYNEVVSGFDKIRFADSSVEDYCVANFDLNSDGKISFTEALAVESFPTVSTKASYGALPNTITSFDELKYFTSITTFPSFEGFASLQSITIPSSVTNIPEGCFSGCTAIAAIVILPTTVPSIGDGAFDGLSGVKVYVPDAYVETYKSVLTSLASCIVGESENHGSDDVFIPDANFKAYCVANFDTNGDGEISVAEASVVTNVDCMHKNISNLNGIGYFTALETLWCNNNQLTSLDVSKNTALETLWCGHNQLTSLDVSKNTALVELYCFNNQLTSLDISKNTSLTYFFCDDNQLTALDVSKNTALGTLSCNVNQLTALDISKNTYLEILYCDNNQFTSLDVSKNTYLEMLSCCGNQLSSLDVSKNIELTYLQCSNNQFASLDVSKNTELADLGCGDNQLTTIDVRNNTALKSLNCSNNQLTSLDVSNNTALTGLACTCNSSLATIYLRPLQVIYNFDYDNEVATIRYKTTNKQILYTTSDDTEIPLPSSPFGSSNTVISNSYDSSLGYGLITCENDITLINNYAFENTKLNGITLPASLKSIGKHAFYYTELSDIIIPEGVTTIKEWAFGLIDKLTTVSIPSTITNLEWPLFWGCTSLTSFTGGYWGITSDNRGLYIDYTYIDEHIGYMLTDTALGGLTTYETPSEVVAIAGNALYSESLTTLRFSDNIQYIYGNYHTPKVSNVYIGSGIKLIYGIDGNYSTVHIAATVAPTVYSYSFDTTYSGGTKFVYYPTGATGYDTLVSTLKGTWCAVAE